MGSAELLGKTEETDENVLMLMWLGFKVSNHELTRRSRQKKESALPKKYQQQRDLYARLFIQGDDPDDKVMLMKKCEEYGLLNLSLLEAYLGAEPTTMDALAAEYQLSPSETEENISVMLDLIGDTTQKPETIRQKAQEMMATLREKMA